MRLLLEFTYLQALDVLTTIAFLMQGIGEGNPIVRWVLRQDPGPVQSLVIMKFLAVLLAIYCVMKAKHGVLRKVNVFFACLVAYNLVVMIISSPAVNF